jgi:hypothetical protein
VKESQKVHGMSDFLNFFIERGLPNGIRKPDTRSTAAIARKAFSLKRPCKTEKGEEEEDEVGAGEDIEVEPEPCRRREYLRAWRAMVKDGTETPGRSSRTRSQSHGCGKF